MPPRKEAVLGDPETFAIPVTGAASGLSSFPAEPSPRSPRSPQEIAVTLPGPPRTKKTHGRIVRVKSGRQFVLPSESYEAWLKAMLSYAPKIRAELAEQGVALPICGPISLEMTVYRRAESGDLAGFIAAVHDGIQVDEYLCNGCRKKFLRNRSAAHISVCGSHVAKQTRKGMGLIEDDRDIMHGNEALRTDKANPRVELIIRPMREIRQGEFDFYPPAAREQQI